MTNQTKIHRHTTRSIIIGFLTLVLVSCAFFLSYMAVRENNRHNELVKSMNQLADSLKSRGLHAELTSGCGRPDQEFGRGDKSCVVVLESKLAVTGTREANLNMGLYSRELANQSWLSSANSLPSKLPHVMNGVDFGAAGYVDNQSQKKCSAGYEYHHDDGLLDISFSCDDTSWFIQTFEN